MKRLFGLVLAFSLVGGTAIISQNDVHERSARPPWSAMAPRSYHAADRKIAETAYQEVFENLGRGKEREILLRRARKVVAEWGGNPNRVKIGEITYMYEDHVSVSQHFAVVIFQPQSDAPVDGYNIAVMFKRADHQVISIEEGG